VSSSGKRHPLRRDTNPSSTPVKRGKDAKAPTAEETAEWKEGLDECLEEVKKLESAPKY
jgi:hypothetical protein